MSPPSNPFGRTLGRTVGSEGPLAGLQEEAKRGEFVRSSEHVEISVIVVTYNSARDIPWLIDGLRVEACNLRIRLIVVDNRSADNTAAIVRRQHDILLIECDRNLGYSGGINLGLQSIGSCHYVLVLNPDLVLGFNAITPLLKTAAEPDVGAVVPLILEADGAIHPSIGYEPSLYREISEAVLGRRLCELLRLRSLFDYRTNMYHKVRDIDWATGAALLVSAETARRIGDWNEDFFLYSEEVEYFRRIRSSGLRVVFTPEAMVTHRAGGSGKSPDLAALQAVNRIRYIEAYHSRVYSVLFRVAVVIRHALRSWVPVHRHVLAYVIWRRRWLNLPRADIDAQLAGESRGLGCRTDGNCGDHGNPNES